MIKKISIINITNEEKVVLLKALGHGTNKEGFIIKNDTEEIVRDRYTNIKIKLENASILPGSTIILDTNSFSLAEYFEEFKEDGIWISN